MSYDDVKLWRNNNHQVDRNNRVKSMLKVLDEVKLNNGKLFTTGWCQSKDLIPEEGDPDDLRFGTALSYA